MAVHDPVPWPMPTPSRGRRTGRDLAWRLAGIAAFGVATLTALAHRAVAAATMHGAPTAWEMVLGLLSFNFASLGVLLLLHGARLFDDPRQARATRHPSIRPALSPPPDGRDAVAWLLAERAIVVARARRGIDIADDLGDARRKEGSCPSSHPTCIATVAASPR